MTTRPTITISQDIATLEDGQTVVATHIATEGESMHVTDPCQGDIDADLAAASALRMFQVEQARKA